MPSSSLPRVTINFADGQLGIPPPAIEGVAGLIISSNIHTGAGIVPDEVHVFYNKKAAMTALNDPDLDTAAGQAVTAFFDNGGSELWMLIKDRTDALSVLVGTMEALRIASTHRISLMYVCFAPDPTSYTPTITDGMDEAVYTAMMAADILAGTITESSGVPLVVLFNAYALNSPMGLVDMHTLNYQRVALMAADQPAAMMALAGRLSSSGVAIHPGRVKDGALRLDQYSVDGNTAMYMDTDTLNLKGVITLKMWPQRSGYYVTDDHMAMPMTSDYANLVRRRVIDKVYRLAGLFATNEINDTVPTTTGGTVQHHYAVSFAGLMEAAIVAGMGPDELNKDEENPADRGIVCVVDTTNNIVQSGTLLITLRVRPFGYNRFIDISLGFSITI